MSKSARVAFFGVVYKKKGVLTFAIERGIVFVFEVGKNFYIPQYRSVIHPPLKTLEFFYIDSYSRTSQKRTPPSNWHQFESPAKIGFSLIKNSEKRTPPGSGRGHHSEGPAETDTSRKQKYWIFYRISAYEKIVIFMKYTLFL